VLLLNVAGPRRTPKAFVYVTGKARKTVLFSPQSPLKFWAVLWSDWVFQDWPKPTRIRPKATSKTEKLAFSRAGLTGRYWT
jgi:hypothetical protein